MEALIGPEFDDDALTTAYDLIKLAIDRLPILDKDAVAVDDTCPICLSSFRSIFADDNLDVADAGVTQLVDCGHVFCRKEYCLPFFAWVLRTHIHHL